MRPSLLLAVLPGLLALLPYAPARADGGEETEPPRVRALVEGLEALAGRCQQGRLFGERDDLYELLLLFRPNHADARRTLEYRRGEDGAWQRSPRHRPARNLRRPDASYREARKALAGAFADATLAAIAQRGAGLDPAVRARWLREAARVAPEREDLRTARGEVRARDGSWQLRASVEAPARRKALQAAARQARTAAPRPKRVRPDADEAAVRLAWTEVLEGPRVRILGTVPAKELREAHAIAHAAGTIFPTVYGMDAPALEGLTLILLKDDDERAALLASHPRATDEFRSFAANLASGWFPRTRTVFARSREPALRLEWCARQPLAALLRAAHGIRTKQGWAFEGFGLYVSHLLCGTRRTFYVRRTEYGEKADPDDDLWTKLGEPDADWRAHARVLLAGPRAPDLRLLLGKEVNTMNTEDMLLAYVLAAYLLEGRPDRVTAVLEAVAAGTAADRLVADTLGLDMEGLDRRLRRWLDETK